ncbi:Gfo/Idh/MocA family oxidoreductase [Streptomyces sp. NPDC001817]|uniref:Gfo/Idh/MocA family protein n=1 Tax=Streptomyces sp. NPDC001817 TaxID=3154398 RepID=UPI00332A9349
MSTVRIGVVGAGTMAADHVRTLHQWVSGAQVVSVADVDEERAAAVAAVAGARAAGDGHALIADPDVDAVVIASHDTTHEDLAVAAVRAGKPVMCEKPLAPTTPNASGSSARSGRRGPDWSRWASCAVSTRRTRT